LARYKPGCVKTIIYKLCGDGGVFMKKALLVIDMQNDYLWEQRKSKFTYDTDKLAETVNSLIKQYNNDGRAVIYIAHIIQNTLPNRKLFGFSIRGTQGGQNFMTAWTLFRITVLKSNGLSVEMLTEGIATYFPLEKIEKLREKMKTKGVKYIS